MGYNFGLTKEVSASVKNKLNRFLASLGPAVSKGEDITFADNDLTYILKLQNKRFKDKGLDVEYEYYSREDDVDHVGVASDWRDSHYSSVVCTKQCGIRRTFSKDGQKLYKDNRKSFTYATVTDVVTDSHPDNDSYCCPNCGAVSTIAQLQSGCSFCGTKYKIDDLFPKVTSYYSLDDVGINSKEGKRGMMFSMIGAMVFTLLLTIIIQCFKSGKSDGSDIVETVLSLILLLPISALGGYFFYSIFLLVRLIVVGSRQSSGKWGTIGSRQKFEARMRKIYPEFSFEYFTSKATSLIKTAVFTDNEQDLLFYKGAPLSPELKDIIDLNYGGALGVNSVEEINGMTYVRTNAFFDVLYYRDDKIFLRRQVFNASFARRTDIPIDYNFSMTKIQCPSCGSSFDAIRNKNCPFCGHTYEIESNDWTLTEFTLK